MMDISEIVFEKFERSSRMNENRALKLFNDFSCSSCKVQFFIKDLTLKGSRSPILLHCGHSVCNNCLHQNLKGASDFTCQICGFVSSWELPVKSSKCFSLNLHMLGNLIVFQSSKFDKDKKLAFLTESNFEFNYAVSGESNFFLKSDSRESICEECSMRATWHCENCKSNFCEICWSKVHSSAKSLTKHLRTAIRDVLRNGLKKCQEHESQLEFFCKNCLKAICSHCVVLQHQGEGHHSITLKEKNLEIFNEVKAATAEAHKMNQRMKQTLKDLKLKQDTFETSENLTYLNLGYEITRKFSRIHGLLQLEEERLLKELQEKSNERENCFRALQTQLEKQVEATEYLLRESEFALKQPQNSDLTDLHRQLIKVKNFPCYLIFKEAVNEQAKLKFDERLIDAIRLYCTLDLPSEELFELYSSSNLPEDYAVGPLYVSELNQSLKSSLSSIPDLETSISDSLRELKREDCDSINVSSTHPKETKVFLERKNYCVRTSFIKNPGEFYVILNSQRAQQKTIDRRASTVARFSSIIPKAYKKDDVFLVKYNVDKKWYRGRVMEVIPSKREDCEDSVVVYYLDYGNFETVPISRLRPIPPDLLEESPLAIKCKLFDCVPQNGEWCADSTKTMERILENNTATMFVIKVHADCLEVDLSVIYLEGQIGRDIVSVRDALMFLGFSSFVHGLKVPRNATVVKYLEQCLPPAGESFEVTVTHVNSPSDFYVQRIDQDASYLYKLAADLQSYYEDTREKGIIFNPTVDLACAALFSADKRWYRAKIVDIPAKKMVTVFYVDYGNKETIPWTEIRKLKESFSKYPPMAFNCSLAGILPPNGLPWSIHAKSFLKKNILMGEGRIVVQGISKCRQKLKVLFHKIVNQMEICLNASFVDMGLAIKTCDTDCLWLFNIQDKEENNVLKKGRNKFSTGSKEKSSKTRRNACKNENFKDRRKHKLSAKELRELHESEKQNHAEEQSSKDTVENEINEYKNIFKVKVEVLSCKSPSSIYVTFPTLMKEFECLQAKLNDFYQDSTSSADEWTVGSSCAVFDSTKLCWFRASILSLLPNERVELFLKDVARVISESVSALRPLDPLFKKFSTCAIKCHLADVKPPGAEWPNISCEFLSEEIETHEEVYMTRKGPTEKESLPIELWVQKVLARGALEPIKKEWITLNRLLVSQGLAIPEQLEMWLGMETSTEDEYSDEQKSLDDTQGESIEPPSDHMNETDSSDVFLPSLDSDWIPPLSITKSCFIGIPTYVDYNAVIYMYDKEEDEENLKKIREVLFKVYENSKPTPDDCFWIPGQLCIARYHVDNFWYRGRILQKNEDLTYDVLFVDYGNVETCQVSDLRKRIKTYDIPTLSHKFKLSGIKGVGEDGVWPESTIDILHSLIVDKKCEVKISKYPQDANEPHIVTLKLIEGDTDVAMFLVEKNLAVLDVPFFFMSQRPGPDCEDSRYLPLIVPDDCNEFFLEVTNISSDTEFFANIIVDQTLPSSLQTVLIEFTTLQKTVTQEGPTQPHVEDITEGHPCCCLDFSNNKWCRGEVGNFAKSKNSISVSYVDYGTEEVLHKDFIRECKGSWLNLPKMAVKFKLGGVEKCSDIPDFAYSKALSSCLNGKLFAEILNRHDNCLEVRLLTDKNGVLAYQQLIDKGLMKLI